jgi:hypothetical protein
MSGAHDLEYKQLFAHPEIVRDLLSGFTSFSCLGELSLSAFERVNGAFVNDSPAERHGDMVWRVRLADDWLFVFLLLEFQSRSDRWMALRMQVYVGLLYQDLIKRHDIAILDKLPPVLPLVLYNGVAAWNAETDLAELLMTSPDGLAAFQPAQRYVLIDQHALDPAALVQQKNLVAALFQLELAPTEAVFNEQFAVVSLWLSDEAQAPLLDAISRWAKQYRSHESLHGTIIGDGTQSKEGIMGERFVRTKTWAEAARDEGIAEGQLIAMRAVIKSQLAKRFGVVPEEAISRIDGASLPQLTTWAGRILDGTSVNEVLAAQAG